MILKGDIFFDFTCSNCSDSGHDELFRFLEVTNKPDFCIQMLLVVRCYCPVIIFLPFVFLVFSSSSNVAFFAMYLLFQFFAYSKGIFYKIKKIQNITCIFLCRRWGIFSIFSIFTTCRISFFFSYTNYSPFLHSTQCTCSEVEYPGQQQSFFLYTI